MDTLRCLGVVTVVGMLATAHAGPAVELTGEVRGRYESLDGQFRRGFTGSDQALFTRALLGLEADFGGWTVGAEVQDSRAFLDDRGTPLSAGFVNAADVLQLYVRHEGPGLLPGPSTGTTTLGRQTISIGSKRQIERVSYANVIRAYTGIYHLSTNGRGDELHAFGAVPVERLPTDREQVGDNAFGADREQWERRLFGIHYRRADALPGLASDLWAEVFAYGLFEEDGPRFQGPDRRYVYPGFRIFRPRRPGRWDIDLEPSVRFGVRRASNDPVDRSDLDVFATRVIAIAGYTFDIPWRPRLAAEWFWASGDEDPGDDRFDRYERLFGSRRTDLNNTSLYGPLTFENLNAPGARLEVTPSPVTDARLVYSAAFLASDTDRFAVARLQDPTGQSGRFMGHAIDGRARYMPESHPVVYEIGGSALLFGRFTQDAPGAPEGRRTLFGYVQATWSF